MKCNCKHLEARAIELYNEIAELREAVAWYFECVEVEKYRTLKILL